MKEAIIAGFVSGLISPLILSWLQHNIIWRNQKRLEIKYGIFSDAIRAMSLYETDALDFELQSNKKSYKDSIKAIELRPETSELIEKSRGLVMAFFSKESFGAYVQVFKAKVSIENVPNIEFDEKRNASIVAMAKELGIDNNPWKSKIKRWKVKLRKNSHRSN